MVNADSIVQHVLQIKSGIMIHECKKYRAYKKDFSWNLSTSFCENSRYLKILLMIQ